VLIVLVGAFSVPVESLAGLNKSSADGDFRHIDGGGVGGLLEGAHQIHCLVSQEYNGRLAERDAKVDTESCQAIHISGSLGL
jgi:hypothetical protein